MKVNLFNLDFGEHPCAGNEFGIGLRERFIQKSVFSEVQTLEGARFNGISFRTFVNDMVPDLSHGVHKSDTLRIRHEIY